MIEGMEVLVLKKEIGSRQYFLFSSCFFRKVIGEHTNITRITSAIFLIEDLLNV